VNFGPGFPWYPAATCINCLKCSYGHDSRVYFKCCFVFLHMMWLFHSVGWAKGRASSLYEPHFIYPQRFCWRPGPLPVESTAWKNLSPSPFPSNRHHWSNGDCLEDKKENYQVCSVQYRVQQLYTVNCTHIWTKLTVLWIEFCITGPISLCLDSFLCMYYFVSDCILHACVVIVRWRGGPGGIEAWSLEPLLPAGLWHCWLGHLTRKTRPWYDL